MAGRAVRLLVLGGGFLGASACTLIIGTSPREVWDGGATVDADAGRDADAEASADADASPTGPCRLDQPFTNIRVDSDLSDAFNLWGEESVRFTPNELEAYVSRRLSQNVAHIFRYQRSKLGDPWVLVGEEPDLNRFPDGGTTSSSNITFFPGAERAFVQYYDVPNSPAGSLSLTTRVDGGWWTLPTPAPGLVTNSQDNAPWLSQDGKTVWFYSDRIAGWHVFVSHARDGGWTDAEAIAIQKFDDRMPVLTGDDRTIYLTSGDLKSRQVYRATGSGDGGFGSAELVEELSTDGGYGWPTWVSPDGCRIAYIHARGIEATHIWVAEKPPL